MLNWKKIAAVAAVVMGSAAAQPALTTIQDVLYRADGSRFTGTMYITYQSFQSADTSNIATANLTVPVVNGSLRVRLVPTTTASAGAQYNITYNAAGINQFTETWAVPATSTTLRVRDVRVGSGSVIGPPPVVSPVQIGDVIGLANELEVRPMRGVGFGLGRAAVINSSGQLDAASGSLTDCVRVDGSAGPCGGGGGGAYPGFTDNETPAGTVNSSNVNFTLASAPNPATSLVLYRNGLKMAAGVDYTLSGNAVTFYVASTPQTGDQLNASYRYADPSNPLGSLAATQVVCSGVGSTTSSTTITSLGSCTIPAGILGSGDHLEIRVQMSHSGTNSGFSGEIRVGGATVIARSAVAGEDRLNGKVDFSLYGSSQTWDSQSWGSTTNLQLVGGSSGEDTSQSVTIQFRGQMGSAGADTISLRNFTVLRHPAQANP